MTEEQIKQELRAWIVKRNGRVRAEDVQDDTRIIENRIVTSLHAMELLTYVERLRGRALVIDEIKPRMLQSIDSIYRGFFEANA